MPPNTGDPTGLSEFGSGMTGAIGENLRSQLWESYQAQSTTMSGVPDPILKVADQLRQKGQVFQDQKSFNDFLSMYGNSVAGKSGDARNAAIDDLVSRHEMAGSASNLSQAVADSDATSISGAIPPLPPPEGFELDPVGPPAPPPLPPPGTGPMWGSDGKVYFGEPAGGGGGIGGGGGGGAGGGGNAEPPGEGGSDPNDPRSVLEQIRDILQRMLDRQNDHANQNKEEEGSPATFGNVMEDAIFGNTPSTPMGRFAHRIRGQYKKLWGSKGKRNQSRIGGLLRMTGRNPDKEAAAAAETAGAVRAIAATTTGAGAAAGAGAAGGGAAGAAAGGGAAVGGAAAAAGPIGVGVAAVTIFATAAVEFGKAVYDFAKAQEGEMRRLGQYGGQQAAAAAQLDAERTLRDIKTAEETGGSATSFADSLNNFENSLQPIESLLTNIGQTVAGRFLDVVSAGLDALKPAVDIATMIYNKLPDMPGKKDPEDLSNWKIFDDIAKERERLGANHFPQGQPAGPRGGSMPYGGTI